MANKIKLARGTKSRIESIKSGMLDYELVYSTDTNELGVKKADGNISYFSIYSAMTQAEFNTGTATTGRTVSAKFLKDNINEIIDAKIVATINGGF